MTTSEESTKTGSSSDTNSDSNPAFCPIFERGAETKDKPPHTSSGLKPRRPLPGLRSPVLHPVVKSNNDYYRGSPSHLRGGPTTRSSPSTRIERPKINTSLRPSHDSSSRSSKERTFRPLDEGEDDGNGENIEEEEGETRASCSPEVVFSDSDEGTNERWKRKAKFLVECRRKGMTYREIRQKGHFTEAESTLRGRYRALTKSKEERVRTPHWTKKDLHLLEVAVCRLGKRGPGGTLVAEKIPWKQVAEYIKDNGGSYRFGNSTARKRWDQLMSSRHQANGHPNMDTTATVAKHIDNLFFDGYHGSSTASSVAAAYGDGLGRNEDETGAAFLSDM
ncbi:hypothetical protein B0T17DRAFT_654263 [Bombardia bombarda]|uniref:Myb-like domain-containing protein n=1 Tax=Bombardia bombarda TaxID=252184 RepID=A0AA40C9Y2_9PEZI|nr:hypothetical protein B0T17DRAFT_654263 [Bombardia bombarda]